MGPYKNSRLVYMAAIVFLSVCIGCTPKTGRFTEEEMAAFPLVGDDALPRPAGGLVLSINTEIITAEEIVRPVVKYLQGSGIDRDPEVCRTKIRPEVADIVSGRVADVLLYQQARKSIPENVEGALDKITESQVNRFVGSYGSNYADAQKAIEEQGKDWQSFREEIKREIVISSFLSNLYKPGKAGDKQIITHDELLAYYDSIRDERFKIIPEIQFRLIDIDSTRLNSEQMGDKSSREAAVQLAGQLFERINRGEDFGELAREFSHDHPSRAENGGLWTPVTLDEPAPMAKDYVVLIDTAVEMKPGDVSEPVQSGNHVFIMKLERKIQAGHVPFEKIRRGLAAEIIFQKTKRQADIAGFDEFVDFCVEKICE